MYDESCTCTSLILPENEPNNSIYRKIQQYLSPKKNATPCEIRKRTLKILIKENKPPQGKKAKNSSDIYNLLVKDETIDEKYRYNLTLHTTRGLIGDIVTRMSSFIGGRTGTGYYFKEDKHSPYDRLGIQMFVQEYSCTPITEAQPF